MFLFVSAWNSLLQCCARARASKINSLFQNNFGAWSDFREIQLQSRISRRSIWRCGNLVRFCGEYATVYARSPCLPFIPLAALVRARAIYVFLFVPFTSVSLSCLRRFPFCITRASTAGGRVNWKLRRSTWYLTPNSTYIRPTRHTAVGLTHDL